MKLQVNYEDFSKLDLRIGTVVHCENKEGSNNLLRLTVDFGIEGTRNILSGLAKWYHPEDLIDKQFVFILNLEPRKLMGEHSEGMILAAEGEKPEPLVISNKVPNGAIIK